MRRAALLIALLTCAAPAASAAPVALKLTYVAYADGFTTVQLTATVNLTKNGYRLAVDYHTLGAIGFLFPGHDEAVAEGAWQGESAEPSGFQSEGLWGGRTFDVRMAYTGDEPKILTLTPNQSARRESVPAALREGTIDTASAMALLIERMADGEGCRMAQKVFDGRRLIALAVRPAGSEQLGITTRSFFHGPAERCDVTGKMLAGFLRSDGPTERTRVNHGTVWFAQPIPGLPLLPVRIRFSTKWFGAAMMYLTDIEAAPPLGPRRVARSPAP